MSLNHFTIKLLILSVIRSVELNANNNVKSYRVLLTSESDAVKSTSGRSLSSYTQKQASSGIEFNERIDPNPIQQNFNSQTDNGYASSAPASNNHNYVPNNTPPMLPYGGNSGYQSNGNGQSGYQSNGQSGNENVEQPQSQMMNERTQQQQQQSYVQQNQQQPMQRQTQKGRPMAASDSSPAQVQGSGQYEQTSRYSEDEAPGPDNAKMAPQQDPPPQTYPQPQPQAEPQAQAQAHPRPQMMAMKAPRQQPQQMMYMPMPMGSSSECMVPMNVCSAPPMTPASNMYTMSAQMAPMTGYGQMSAAVIPMTAYGK